MKNHGYGTTVDALQKELDETVGAGKTEVTEKNGELNVKFIDTGRTYVAGDVYKGNLDWNSILADANQNSENYKYSGQTSEYIAIGTDGKPVNMDLWNPTVNEDGTTWLLGSTENHYTSTDAYKGGITTDGKIEGCVPQYIYNETKGEFTPVTKMRSTFYYKEGLITAPNIPSTVTDMFGCFAACIDLKNVSELPENLNDMRYTFYYCKSLTGDLVINANPTQYDRCLYGAAENNGCSLKLSGNSTMLNEILSTATYYNTLTPNSNVTLK